MYRSSKKVNSVFGRIQFVLGKKKKKRKKNRKTVNKLYNGEYFTKLIINKLQPRPPPILLRPE